MAMKIKIPKWCLTASSTKPVTTAGSMWKTTPLNFARLVYWWQISYVWRPLLSINILIDSRALVLMLQFPMGLTSVVLQPFCQACLPSLKIEEIGCSNSPLLRSQGFLSNICRSSIASTALNCLVTFCSPVQGMLQGLLLCRNPQPPKA